MVVNARSLTVRERPEDVTIVARTRVAQWLQAQPPRLDPEMCERMFAAARRSGTWDG